VHEDLSLGIGEREVLHKGDEVLGAALGLALAEHLARADIEGREQRPRAVAYILELEAADATTLGRNSGSGLCSHSFNLCGRKSSLRKILPTSEWLSDTPVSCSICDWHQDLFCDINGPIPLCAGTAQDGEVCTADLGCILGSHCARGECAPLKASGAACERDGACVGRTCDDGRCIDRLVVPDKCSPLAL